MYADRENLVREICARLSTGEPLAQICRDMHMPGVQTVADWAAADDSISVSIARAREAGFDAIAADCLAIADDSSQDFKQVFVAGDTPDDLAKAPKAFDSEHVQRSKLRVDTRLKLLAKWDPKRYGEKQQVEHSGTIDSATTIIESRKRSGRN